MTQCIYTRRLAVGLIIAGAFTCYCLLQTAVRRGSCLGLMSILEKNEAKISVDNFLWKISELNLTRHTNIFSLDVHSMLQIHSTHRLLASSDDKRQESIMGLLTKAVRARKLCQGQNVVRIRIHINADPDVCRIGPKTSWIHLVGVSIFVK